jgi:hypothetical protein
MPHLEKISIAPHLAFDALVAGEAGSPLVVDDAMAIVAGTSKAASIYAIVIERSDRQVPQKNRGYEDDGLPGPTQYKYIRTLRPFVYSCRAVRNGFASCLSAFLIGACLFNPSTASGATSSHSDLLQQGIAGIALGSDQKAIVAVNDTDPSAKSNINKLDLLLNQLDRRMPRRQISGLELDVSDTFQDLMPSTGKIADAIAFFNDAGYQPNRSGSGTELYVYFLMKYAVLSSAGRNNFRNGDRLIVRFRVTDRTIGADITALYAVVLNDSGL